MEPSKARRTRRGHLKLVPRPGETNLPAPIGISEPVKTRDGRALERSGTSVYESRRVYDEVIEVRFADGEWLLCDAEELHLIDQ